MTYQIPPRLEIQMVEGVATFVSVPRSPAVEWRIYFRGGGE